MNYPRKKALSIILSVIPILLLGQNPFQVEGFVRDSVGTPLDFVSVYATVKDAIVSFSNTNEKGFYSLTIPSDSIPVSVSASILGFKKESFSFDIQEIRLGKKRLDFVLLPNPFLIEEVVVRDKVPPIITKLDTTEYHLAAFSDSTEYSVEDILKKLPGVQVSEQGTITVNGKSIDKVLIEGDDVFGVNYTIVTRNVRANMIDKVQVIDHYQENPVLKNVMASESTVLNLSIHEDKKRILSGTLTMGAGRGKEWKGYAHNNLFSFSKKAKTVLLGNSNNIGFNASGELEAMSGTLFSSGQSLRRGILPNRSQLALPQAQELGLPTYFTNQSRSGMVALNQNYKFTDQFKIKASATVLIDRWQQTYSNQTDFLLENQFLSIGENTAYLRKRKSLEAEVETNYFSPRQKSSFRTISNIQAADNRLGISLIRSLLNQEFLIPISILNTPKNYFSAAEYITKTGKHSFLQFAFNYSQTTHPQQLNASSENYPLFFDIDSSFNKMKQNLAWEQESFTPYLRHVFHKRGYEISIEGGSNLYKNKLTSEIFFHNANANELLVLEAPYYNNQKIRKRTSYLRSYTKKIWGKLDVGIGLDIQRLSLLIKDSNNLIKQKRALWVAEPAFKFQYAPNNDLRLNLMYKYITELPNDENLFDSFYMLDYQTAYKGMVDLSLINKHQFSASYRYRALEKTFFFSTNFSAFLSGNQWGTSFVFSPLVFSQAFFQPINEKIYRFQLRAENFFSKIDSRISFNFNFSSFNTENQVNNVSRNILNNYYTYIIDYGSSFDGWFNFFFTNEVLVSKTTVNQHFHANIYRSIQWKSRVKGVFKLGKKAYFDASLYSVSNYFEKKNLSDFYSMDINAALRIGKEKWQGEIKFRIVNPFDNSVFQQFTISDYYQNQFQLETVPRFFIVIWDASF